MSWKKEATQILPKDLLEHTRKLEGDELMEVVGAEVERARPKLNFKYGIFLAGGLITNSNAPVAIPVASVKR